MTNKQLTFLALAAMTAIFTGEETIEVATRFTAVLDNNPEFQDTEETRNIRISLTALDMLDDADEDREWHEDEIFSALCDLAR